MLYAEFKRIGFKRLAGSLATGPTEYKRDQRTLFSVVFTPSPPSHYGSVLLVISLLLTNTVQYSRCRLV
jgi:hypothetical protein